MHVNVHMGVYKKCSIVVLICFMSLRFIHSYLFILFPHKIKIKILG